MTIYYVDISIEHDFSNNTKTIYLILTIKLRGPSINVNIFTSVQIIHFHIFSYTFNFWFNLYYIHGDFWHSKNVDVYSFGESGSPKVYGLYTHDIVDMYGRPLSHLHDMSNFYNIFIDFYFVSDSTCGKPSY